jgi:molybdopterin converting factor small subunit
LERIAISARADSSVAPSFSRAARAFLDRLCAKFPTLAPYASSLRVAINGTYAAWDEPVRDGDEVAIIPPVAGG